MPLVRVEADFTIATALHIPLHDVACCIIRLLISHGRLANKTLALTFLTRLLDADHRHVDCLHLLTGLQLKAVDSVLGHPNARRLRLHRAREFAARLRELVLHIPDLLIRNVVAVAPVVHDMFNAWLLLDQYGLVA